MERRLKLRLRHVQPVPASLRARPETDLPAEWVSVHLGQLYQHYYFDCYPGGPPIPDLSRFEYLQHLAATTEFRFLDHIDGASTTKKRGLSTDLGQAFCRWALDTHFGIPYFAHLNTVIDRPLSTFGGMRLSRSAKGDLPDYLCARKVTDPMVAEAKGRFSAIAFANAEFQTWRKQFKRIEIRSGAGKCLSLKGFIVATRFATADRSRTYPALYIEDPHTPGEEAGPDEDLTELGRVIVAVHYGRVFRKLQLDLLAASLEGYGSTPNELTFQVPVWTCIGAPFVNQEFVGGFYRTRPGHMPRLIESGWELPMELGAGHGVFVGLKRDIAVQVAAAARGSLETLDNLQPLLPEGLWGSEFSWLRDGTVVAPMTYFAPTGVQVL